jgi:hypothetical protein
MIGKELPPRARFKLATFQILNAASDAAYQKFGAIRASFLAPKVANRAIRIVDLRFRPKRIDAARTRPETRRR